MRNEFGRRSPALLIACAALLSALGGTVYAATKIDGRTIRLKSIPGNRLAPGSLPGNRLAVGALGGARLTPGSVTGTQIDSSTLGQVPSAVHADNADSARTARAALSAASAADAGSVNGHTAGCREPTRPFAGACWQVEASTVALTPAAAAASCAAQGGELPDPLPLAAFSQQPAIDLAESGEWTGDTVNASGFDGYSVMTVTPSGMLGPAGSATTKKYRCVIPLVS